MIFFRRRTIHHFFGGELYTRKKNVDHDVRLFWRHTHHELSEFPGNASIMVYIFLVDTQITSWFYFWKTQRDLCTSLFSEIRKSRVVFISREPSRHSVRPSPRYIQVMKCPYSNDTLCSQYVFLTWILSNHDLSLSPIHKCWLEHENKDGKKEEKYTRRPNITLI